MALAAGKEYNVMVWLCFVEKQTFSGRMSFHMWDMAIRIQKLAKMPSTGICEYMSSTIKT